MKITKAQLQAVVDSLNVLRPGKGFALDYIAAYGGYTLEDAKGNNVLNTGRNPARAMYDLLWAYRYGIENARADMAAQALLGGR